MRSRLDTPKSRREAVAEQLKLDLSEDLAAERTSERAFAREIEVSKTGLRNKLDADSDANFSLVDLLLAPKSFRERVVRRLARAEGFDLAPMAIDSSEESALHRAADLLAASSQTVVEAIAARRDHVLDRAEAHRIKPHAESVRRIATEIVVECDRAISEGVIALSRGGDA